MAINFPHNPNVNDVHTESSLGKSWRWDGTTWLIYSSSTTGIGYSDLSVTTEAAQGGGSLTYNDANGQFTFRPATGSGGGATNFTGLGDTPSSLLAGKWLKVNVGGTALEWTDAPTGNDTNDYLNTASLSGTTLTLTRTGTQSLSNVTVDLSSLNSVPTTITVANENTDTECYPLFTTVATGNLEPKTVTSFKLNSSSGQLEAGSFKKTGGSSAEFLKADGSVDSTTYLSSAPSYALNDLSDVTTGTISDGDVLKYSGTNSRWEAQTDATGGSGSFALNDLTNVDAVTGVANGKILKYNGTSWEVADDQSGGGGGGGGNVAVGSVMIWSGSAVSIPSGWQLCDGTNGSPDLRDRFVVGAGSTYAVDATGGSADAVVVSHNHGITDPGHDHDVEVVTDSGSGNNSNVDQNSNNSNGVTDTTGIQSNTTGITVNNEGVSGTNANLPPYYALCYIYCTAAGSNQTFIGLGDTPGSYTANQWLKVNSAGNGVEFTNAPSDNNTTYDLTASDGSVATEEKIILTGSDSSEDAVTLAVSGSLTIARSNNTITFGGGGGSNTTYDLAASADSGNAKITLSGSDSTNDDVTFSAGGGITYAVTGNTVQISSANSLGGLTDTTITGSPTDNYVLTYDAGSSKWEPQPVPSGSTPSLNDVLGAGNTSALAATVGDFQCANLTVTGTTTTVNSNTVNIGDNILVLNSDEAGTPSQNGGIEIERGTSTNVSLRWNETTDKWQYTNDGTNYSDIGSSTTDTNTTYSISCVDGDNADEEKIRLTDSTSSTDDVVLEAGTGLSIARSGDKITFTNTVSDTTLDLIDEDDMASNSATRPPSQQSVKAYVDANSGGTDTNDYVNTASFSGNTLTLGRTGSLADLTVNIGTITGVPTGTIIMYNGDTAPAGWCLCDGVTRTINGSSYTPPDLRDKFIVGAGSSYNRGSTAGSADAVVVSHSHTGGDTGNQSANHSHGSGNYSGNTSTHNGHSHGNGNYGTSTHNGHSHGSGNYSGNTSTHNGHTHGQSGSGSGNTGNQSANHYHTIGGNKPDGSPGTWNANISGGGHGHSYRVSNGHPQSNMSGIQRTGGDDPNSTNNTDILSSGGGHNHTVNLTGITTAGISENHTHSFNFNIGGNTDSDGNHSHNVNFSGNSGSDGNHSHNVSGNSGSDGNHSHNVNFSGDSGNQSANHTHSFNVGSEGVSGTGKNLPPYYAITFIIKT